MKRAMLLLAVPVVLAACSESGGPGVGAGMGRVNLSVSARRSMFATSNASVALAGGTMVIAADSDTVTVDSVELVVRRIKLKPIETAACDTSDAGDDGEHSDSNAVAHSDSNDVEHHDSTGDDGEAERGSDGCEEIKAGPVLVSLPLGDSAVIAMVSVTAPAGQYDKLEFKIHAPRLPQDSAFIAANPGWDSIAIKVTGSFSHAGTQTPFTFTSRLDAEQEVELSPALVVDSSKTANVTLRFDLSGWFVGEGGGLLDPSNAANAELIEENIRGSINAFEDDNHDGHDDHSEGGGEGDG